MKKGERYREKIADYIWVKYISEVASLGKGMKKLGIGKLKALVYRC